MPTLVACAGMEWGTTAGLNLGPFDGTTGTLDTDVQVIAGAARTGSYGLRVALTAKNAFWSTTTLGASQTALVVSLWFKVSTNPSGDTDIISIDTAASTDRAGFFFQSSTGKLAAWISTSNQVSSANVNDGAWHLLQWRYDVSGTQTLDWSLDGVAGTSVSNGASTTVTRLTVGNRSAGSGVCDYDDIAVSVTSGDYPLGGHAVRLLTVDPAGTVTSNSTTNFRRFVDNGTIDGAWDATAVRNAIDEVPPTIGATADGAVQISNNTTGYMELPMTSYTLAGGETISGVRMLACGWAANTTAATVGFRSYNGTTETTLYATADPGFDASTTTPAWVCRMLTLADVDTQGELDALAFRVGFSDDAAPDVGIHAIYAEVAVLAAASVPWNPQRSTQLGDPGRVPWLQRDPRDANTVATAADPLPSPLDTAWQAGAQYWHLYNDSATRDRRLVPQQRAYVSDPNLLVAVATDPLTLAAGVGGDMWRRYNLSVHVDRRTVPQQPGRVPAPGLLDTAELENELLGGSETGKRHLPATHADRRTVPQQRVHVSDPALLSTALLEGELLGGGDTARRLTWFADRRTTVFVPRPAPIVEPPGDADPLLLLGDLSRRRVVAVTHADRRPFVHQPRRLVDASTVTVKATSAATVAATYTSTASVTAGRTSGAAVTAGRTSTPGVT